MTAPGSSLALVELEAAPAGFNKWLRFVVPLVYAKKHNGAAIPSGVLDLATDAYFAGLLMGDDLQTDVRARLADESRPHLDSLIFAGLEARARGTVWQLDGGMAADAAWFLMAGTPAAGRIMGRRAGRSAVDLQADGLRAWHALWHSQAVDALAAGLKAPRHPAGPLVAHFVASFPPPAKPDRWPRATLPRLVTRERSGELPAIEAPIQDAIGTPQLAGLSALTTPPQQADLPGLELPDATLRGVAPSSWLILIDGIVRITPNADPRERQRALRLLIEVVSTPDPRERVGTKRVHTPIGGPDCIVRRLWNDGRTREHEAALHRAAAIVSATYLPVTDGPLPFLAPAHLLSRQGARELIWDVTYPRGGGNGAAFDRAAFRRYGVHPRLFRVYLAAVWALDARQLRQRDGASWLAALPLDRLAALAAYPDVARTLDARRQWRKRTKAALARLATDGALGGFDLAGHGSRQQLAIWRPRPQLAAPADGRDCG